MRIHKKDDVKKCETCKHLNNTKFPDPCDCCMAYDNFESEPPKGRKDDDCKLRWDLLPIEPIEEIVKAYTFGAKKYAPNNWQNLEDFENRYYRALLRHLAEWRKGNKIDGESGLNHMVHVAWNAIALLWKELKDNDEGNSN